MRRHMRIFWTGVFIAVIVLSLAGCKVKKSDKSTYDIKASQTEDITTTMNSEKETETQSGSKSETESNTLDQQSESSEETTGSWKKTNYYDKEGNLRKTVTEGSINNKKKNSQSNKQNKVQASDSTYNNIKTKENIDSASVSSSYNNVDTRIDIDQNTQSDSRLIQGVEWLFAIVGVVLVVGVLIFSFRKKIF